MSYAKDRVTEDLYVQCSWSLKTCIAQLPYQYFFYRILVDVQVCHCGIL